MIYGNKLITLTKDNAEITVPIGFSFNYLLFGIIELIKRKDLEWIVVTVLLYSLSILATIFEKNFLYLGGILFTNVLLSLFYNKIYIIKHIVYLGYAPKDDKDMIVLKEHNIIKGL